MPLVTSKKIILDAQQDGYAVAAFNVENMEMAQAVIWAAEEIQLPVILQTTPSTIRYGSMKLYQSMIAALAKDSKAKIAIHLDHGDSYEIAVEALRMGYTSLMIDGSSKSFEDNIVITKKIVEMARVYDIPVEGELGRVGGKEDNLESDGLGYTDPEQAAMFVKRTGVFSLAIGIGTSHGVYASAPKLDLERISMVRKKIQNPLVLHGTSGISEECVKECIHRGICKVNYATELRQEFTRGVKDALKDMPNVIDPKLYLNAAREKVKAIAKIRMLLCSLKS